MDIVWLGYLQNTSESKTTLLHIHPIMLKKAIEAPVVTLMRPTSQPNQKESCIVECLDSL